MNYLFINSQKILESKNDSFSSNIHTDGDLYLTTKDFHSITRIENATFVKIKNKQVFPLKNEVIQSESIIKKIIKKFI